MILYISSQLPARSMTFVYNEIFALRERGVSIAVASVHPPEHNLGDERLDALAQEAIELYSRGFAAICGDALRQLVAHPTRTLGTIGRACLDAMSNRDCPLPKRPKVFFQALAGLSLAQQVRGRGIKHIHAHMAHVPTTIAMYTAMQLGVGFSFTGHAADLFPERALLNVKLMRARFTACISEWHQHFYHNIVPELNEQQLPIVRCGVRVDSIEQSSSTREEPPASRARIVAVGRLISKKGFSTLIDALVKLRQTVNQDVECLIIGDGPQRKALEQQIASLGLADIVQLAGAKANEEVRSLLPSATLFVLPCQVDPAGGDRDGIPVALMEAMASGVCVITGRLSPIDELVRHNQTGMLIEPGNVDVLAHTIRDLLDDAERREALAAAGQRWVRRQFSEQTNVECLLGAFGQCNALDGMAEKNCSSMNVAAECATLQQCEAPV